MIRNNTTLTFDTHVDTDCSIMVFPDLFPLNWLCDLKTCVNVQEAYFPDELAQQSEDCMPSRWTYVVYLLTTGVSMLAICVMIITAILFWANVDHSGEVGLDAMLAVVLFITVGLWLLGVRRCSTCWMCRIRSRKARNADWSLVAVLFAQTQTIYSILTAGNITTPVLPGLFVTPFLRGLLGVVCAYILVDCFWKQVQLMPEGSSWFIPYGTWYSPFAEYNPVVDTSDHQPATPTSKAVQAHKVTNALKATQASVAVQMSSCCSLDPDDVYISPLRMLSIPTHLAVLCAVLYNIARFGLWRILFPGAVKDTFCIVSIRDVFHARPWKSTSWFADSLVLLVIGLYISPLFYRITAWHVVAVASGGHDFDDYVRRIGFQHSLLGMLVPGDDAGAGNFFIAYFNLVVQLVIGLGFGTLGRPGSGDWDTNLFHSVYIGPLLVVLLLGPVPFLGLLYVCLFYSESAPQTLNASSNPPPTEMSV